MRERGGGWEEEREREREREHLGVIFKICQTGCYNSDTNIYTYKIIFFMIAAPVSMNGRVKSYNGASICHSVNADVLRNSWILDIE